jgi:hypothetical protein
MSDVFHESMLAKSEFLQNEYGGYDVDSPDRFLAVVGERNASGEFGSTWFDSHAKDLNEADPMGDYISLSLSNNAWNWQNFMKPNKSGEKPTMPNYSLVEKAFDGFCIRSFVCSGQHWR